MTTEMQLWSNRDDAIAYAEDLAKATVLKAAFKGKPSNVLYAMEVGANYGLSPVASMANIHVFETTDKNGIPQLGTAISADLMVKLARDAGHIVHIKTEYSKTGNPVKVTGTLIRGDFPPDRIQMLKEIGYSLEEIRELMVFTEIWDDVRVAKANLMTKNTWKQYTEDMMRARVKSGLVRLGASEVLMGGIQHTADELGADTDQQGVPILDVEVVEDEVPAKPKTTRRAPAKPKAAAAPEPEPEAEIVEDDDPDEGGDDVAPEAVVEYAVSLLADTETSDDEKVVAILDTLAQAKEHGVSTRMATVDDTKGTVQQLIVQFSRDLVAARPQAVVDYAIEVANSAGLTDLDKAKRLGETLSAVKLFGIEESEVRIGDGDASVQQFLTKIAGQVMARLRQAKAAG